MKAVCQHSFGEPEVLQLEDVPDPQAGAGQVVVQIHAVGINPVETYLRSGIYGKPPTPLTLGSDAAGIIESIGTDVTNVSVGDRVYIAGAENGTYAEKALCKATNVHPLPDRASFAQGAAINVPYATAYQAMFNRGRAQAGETLFVHGASGGVGIAAVQLARAGGIKVIGSAGTERGLELVKAQGAHHVLNHTEEGYLAEVMEFTEGKGADCILEMLANVNLGNDLNVLASGGRVVLIGNRGENNQGSVEINPRAAMARDADILGMTLYNATKEEQLSMHAAIVAGLENGSLAPVIGQEFSLADASQAHHSVVDSRAYGKIVLIP